MIKLKVWERVRGLLALNGDNGFAGSKALRNKQLFSLLVFAGVGTIILLLAIILFSKGGGRAGEQEARMDGADEAKRGKIKIEVANKALDPEKMWRNHFEDKLQESQSKVEKQLQVIEQSFTEKKDELASSTERELKAAREQLDFARLEMQEATREIKQLREAQPVAGNAEEANRASLSNVTSHLLGDDKHIEIPKSSYDFIPETSYVQGVLLGGINVSTSIGSQSDPVPVIIRITGRGNFPKEFAIDVRNCRILGSSYGDLSSERAIVRAEVLSCYDDKARQVITTKVAGVIFGDDGANGIKGRVVQTSNKQLQHAFMGGMLSGLSGTAKSSDQFSITSMGAINTKKSNFGERLQNNSLSGLGTAGEKIADYYLKQAEMMSPVLQISGGTKVDVVFTKGVHLGSLDVRSRIENERKSSSQVNQSY